MSTINKADKDSFLRVAGIQNRYHKVNTNSEGFPLQNSNVHHFALYKRHCYIIMLHFFVNELNSC